MQRWQVAEDMPKLLHALIELTLFRLSACTLPRRKSGWGLSISYLVRFNMKHKEAWRSGTRPGAEL